MNHTPEQVTTEAYNLIVQRPDGAGFAATSLDRVQQLGTTMFEPDVDLRPSELIMSDQLFGSSLKVHGGHGGKAFSQSDLQAGRWGGAGVELLMSNWTEDTSGFSICNGELGEVIVEDGKLSLSVDLTPAAARLQPCVQTSPECRAVLGDQQCRVDLRSRRTRVTMTATDRDGITFDRDDLEPFVMGRLRWISGADCGLDYLIIAVVNGKLVLQDAVRSAKVGDRAILTEGCDGRRQTCSARFGNILNFRGEPDLPGSDILMRLPGA